MNLHLEPDAALTVALGLVLGTLGQALARHLRIPGIVVLLALGVVVGPDLLGALQPGALGEGLQILIGFAVSIILFEGAMCLDIRQLRREAVSIRRIVTWGAAVTALGATVVVRLVLGWEWTPSILFGTLVIVTGPTVVNPLLRRIRVERKVSTVLEAEGIFGDAVGAIVAVVALEVLLAPSGETFALGFGDLLMRFGIGTAVGVAAGLLMVGSLRVEGLVPEGLENIFSLTLVLLTFQVSNGLSHESGIVAVIVAGLLVGNVRLERIEDLREFKEQLTVMFIGLLFVLLAADVRLADVRALGGRGLIAVALLMLVVRPLNVAIGTLGGGLTLRQKAFLAWMAPRGIVAAAVASLFALRLDEAGIAGGIELRALVFLTIAVTVLVAGLTGGPMAYFTGVRAKRPGGVVILGANAIGLALGEVCRTAGRAVVFIDANPNACSAAEESGFQVLYGSGLNEHVLGRAALPDRDAALAVTTNEGVNFAFGRRVRSEARRVEVLIALRRGQRSVTPEMVERMGGSVLFGAPRDLVRWIRRLERDEAVLQVFCWIGDEAAIGAAADPRTSDGALLPLAFLRKRQLRWPVADSRVRAGDLLSAMVFRAREEEVLAAMSKAGWSVEPAPDVATLQAS
ncbi:MAG TPA: cation:proton antiporter [Thermoanaerobaculia bacterium]|nr:cation:proton antiporter [Thermoanaerobaculia bacterium]